MDLHEYPRPANDTGLGVHWSVGFASTIGMGKIRDFWLPELKAMGVKWVKIFNHDGAIDFAELLLAEGFMPVVRIYRPSPYPSTFDVRDVVHVDALIRAGVRYFEFNPEPDHDAEWKGGRVPANAIDLVVENVIANLDTLLERGAMPAIPAVANGSRWDLVGKIIARGRKDIFNGPVWQAIHNFPRNRPLDYPYDIGNQEGAAYTQRFYQAIAGEDWGEDAWRGRSLQQINRLRLDRCNPGATIMDDNDCWLAYEFFDARNRRHLGHSIPILSTETGYIVGEDGDPRYPATTPDLHMAQTLEACRIIMGTSHRFQAAPDYYFCGTFWLLGNALLGSSSTWCENHAWYSDRWPGGMLPIVRALKAEPKVVRRWQGDIPVGARTILHGTVHHAADRRTVVLERGGTEAARATLDANSRYVIPDLLPGNYTLRVEGTAIEQPVSLTPGQESALVNLDLAESFALSGSTLVGKVRGGAGAVIMLLRTSDGEEWVTMAKDDGAFRFVDLPPGFYNLRVQGEGSHISGIMLDGKNTREVEVAVAGWGYTVTGQETTGARGPLIRCRVEGRAGIQVRAGNGEWTSDPVAVGSAPDLGSDGCEIPVVEPGYYVVEVLGLLDLAGAPVKLEAPVNVERRTVPLVEFVYSDLEYSPTDLHNSSIRGKVIGGCSPSRRLQVRLIDDQANRRETPVGPDCAFAFEGLGAGLYTVELVGFADVASRSDIALDGKNTVAIELMAPVEDTFALAAERRRSGVHIGSTSGMIVATVPEGDGRVAKLTDATGNELRRVVEPDATVAFDGLAANIYALTVEGGFEQTNLIVDGENGVEVIFQPLTTSWEAKVSPAGSMPGYSVVRVEVEGLRGLPVYIWKEDWEGMMRRTGSKPDYGECAAEFSPLGPGHYMVEPEGIGIWADVELTGLEVVWIDFRRKSVPSEPNIVRPYAKPPRHDSLSPAPRPSQPPGGLHEAADLPYTEKPEVGADRFDEPIFDQSSATEPRFDGYTYGRADTTNAEFDEPTFDEEPGPTETGYLAEGDADKAFEEYPSAPRDEDEVDWRSGLATSSSFQFNLPALTGPDADGGDTVQDDTGQDDLDEPFAPDRDDAFALASDAEELDAAPQPFDEKEGPAARVAAAVFDNPAPDPPPDTAMTTPPAASVPPASTSHRLCLLIPAPLTDLDDLTALLRFVATAQPVMARTVDEVPTDCRVWLIGVSGTEDWTQITHTLAERNIPFEIVTKRLAEAFADLPHSGL